jgi:uncharacterized OB-fold protein
VNDRRLQLVPHSATACRFCARMIVPGQERCSCCGKLTDPAEEAALFAADCATVHAAVAAINAQEAAAAAKRSLLGRIRAFLRRSL